MYNIILSIQLITNYLGVAELEAPFNCANSSDWTYEKCEIYVAFDNNCKIHAWVFTPRSNSSKPNSKKKYPVVLMASGLSSQKDMGLEAYSKIFADSRIASVIIDYRSFGGSFCENDAISSPRNAIYPPAQVEDVVMVAR